MPFEHFGEPFMCNEFYITDLVRDISDRENHFIELSRIRRKRHHDRLSDLRFGKIDDIADLFASADYFGPSLGQLAALVAYGTSDSIHGGDRRSRRQEREPVLHAVNMSARHLFGR